jgi:molybdenum cofactor cytidylyltransferase
MGCIKLLLDYEGEPLVARAVNAALAACLNPVVVVTGAYDPQIREALTGSSVQCVTNETWQQGQSSSIRAGVCALRRHIDSAARQRHYTELVNPLPEGLVIMVADQPFVTAQTLKALVACFEEEQTGGERRAIFDPVLPNPQAYRPLIVTSVDERLGNPVLFPLEYLGELERLKGDKGARSLFVRFPLRRCPSKDKRVFEDIDTPFDYQALH